jgi:DNA-binding PadR family transcriptional regulator
MNLSRLMVLGLLANHGPRHGHQIRRDAEMTNVGVWGGVNVGALYRELHRMEEEGLVGPVRTEQVGRRPARTVYQITDEGHRELHVLRAKAIVGLHNSPDTLGVALLFGQVVDQEELVALLRARRQAIANALASVTAKRAHLQERGFLTPLDVAVFRRSELQMEAELRWHDEVDKIFATRAESTRAGGQEKSRKRGKKNADDRS